MIEMNIRAVKRAGEDRLVAVLERGANDPANSAEQSGTKPGRLLITVSRPEAHVLYHELRAEKTLPGQTYELMAQVIAQLNGRLTAVELVADDAGKPSARLRLERTDGRATVQTRAGQALALAVHLKVPLLVAEALLASDKAERGEKSPVQRSAVSDALVADEDAPPEVIPPTAVPEVFLRAFDPIEE
ncbi:MAG: bifunctional nuclease family protein [Microbacteriaceae bacterium]|nr:bifunctional nuclease family protein [Microbacteriaceae bacterium]